MAATDRDTSPRWEISPHPDDPQFAGIWADLARLYLRHRLDLGLTLASDEWIIEHTNDITATIHFLCRHAHERGDYEWLRRHGWWLRATTRLFNGQAATPLDS